MSVSKGCRLYATAGILAAIAVGVPPLAGATPAGTRVEAVAAADTLRVQLAAPEGGAVAEGTTGHFGVSVTGSTAGGAVTVQYSVFGTATAGVDYLALSGEVTVPQGEAAAQIALAALDDGILDPGETVVLALTGATGPTPVAVDATPATATIADDGSVEVSLAASPDTVAEGGVWSSAVTMSGPVAEAVQVRWWTTDGTAVAGRDYVAVDRVLSFAPGETSKLVEVETLRDDDAEPVEAFNVSLGRPPHATGQSDDDGVAIDGSAMAAYIQCSVAFPPDVRTLFDELTAPVPAGTVIGTVAAETTGGIPHYWLEGRDAGSFAIDVRAEISASRDLTPGSYRFSVHVRDECGAEDSVRVTVVVKRRNEAPDTVGGILDVSIKEGRGRSFDASAYFEDAPQDTLEYSALTSNAGVAQVSVADSIVTYLGVSEGSATVTVTATDQGGLSAAQRFMVMVTPNVPPEPVGRIPDAWLTKGGSASLDASPYFSDPDGDTLRYSAASSPTGVVGVSVSDSTVTYWGVGASRATVTVTATDRGGLSAEQIFDVTVNEPPDTVGGIPDDSLKTGDSKSLDASSYFRDTPGDTLEYSVAS